MEIVIGLAVAVAVALFIRGVLRRIFGSPKELQIRVRPTMETNPETGYRYAVFALEVRGHVSVPHDQCPVEFRLHLFEGEGDEMRPVLSKFEGMQEVDTFAFEMRSDPTPIPFHNSAADWSTLFTVPKEVLVFPERGVARLNFQLCVIAPNNPPLFQAGFTDGTTGVTYAISHTSCSYNNQEEGYEECEGNRRQAMQLTTELALHVAAIDGDLASAEAGVVKSWMRKALSMIPEEHRTEEKNILVEATRRAYADAEDGKTDLHDIIRRFMEVAASHEKYEALELCMDVMAADGVADAKELQEIDQIARAMQIDPKTYRELREQRLAKVQDVSGVSDNIGTMLGLTPDMGPEDIKAHLTGEYRKWNSRVNHTDEKVRKRAEEMLLMIGEVRSKYVD